MDLDKKSKVKQGLCVSALCYYKYALLESVLCKTDFLGRWAVLFHLFTGNFQQSFSPHFCFQLPFFFLKKIVGFILGSGTEI